MGDIGSAIVAAINGATSSGGFTGEYSYTAGANQLTIYSSVFAGPLTISYGPSTGGGLGASSSGAAVSATGYSTDNGQVAKVAITGTGITSPLIVAAQTATTTAATGNGSTFTGPTGTAVSGMGFALSYGTTSVTTSGGPTTVPTNTSGTTTSATVTVSGSDTLTLNGVAINLNAQNAGTLNQAIATINQNTSQTNVSASADATGTYLVLTATKLGGSNFSVAETGGNIGINNSTAFNQNAQNLEANIYDDQGNQLGGTIIGSGAGGNVIQATPTSTVDYGGADGLTFTMNYLNAAVNGVANTMSVSTPGGTSSVYSGTISLTNSLVYQIGPNANQTASLSLQKMTADQLGQNVSGLSNPNTTSLADINVTTASGAQDALQVIDAAISQVSSAQATLGAFQNNTLEATSNNLNTAMQNTSAAQSTIRDTDYAAETANFTQSQVLVQAGTTVLSNANATSQLILNLLKGT